MGFVGVSVSIVVPVYNIKDYVTECVGSLLSQTYFDLEIILIDDGSTDGSAEVCDSLGKRDSRIKVFHKANGGLSSARNFGLSRASGKYTVFVDGDDVVSKDFVSTLMRAMSDGPDSVSIVGLASVARQDCKLIKDSGEGCVVSHLSPRQAIVQLLIQGLISEYACAKMMDTALWKKHPFPEGRVYEDLSVMLMVLDNARDVAVVDKDLYGQVFRPGSITRTKSISCKQYQDAMLAIDENIAYIHKHYGSELENELTAFTTLRYMKLVRLYNDVMSPDTRCNSIRERSRSYLQDSLSLIRRCDALTKIAKLKVELILKFPEAYEILYQLNEARKAKGVR